MALELAEDVRWIRAHSRELQEKYGGMYVAIHNKKVIVADKDPKKVYKVARQYGEKAIVKYVLTGDLFVL